LSDGRLNKLDRMVPEEGFVDCVKKDTKSFACYRKENQNSKKNNIFT